MSKIVTNTTSSTGAGEGVYNTQEYGASADAANLYYTRTFGYDEISIFNSTGEGIFSGKFTDGTTGFFTSRTIAKTIDLIGEGEIEGIVSGEWVPSGTNPLGQVGWEYVNFEPFSDTQPESWLRSIYLNDTPVVNANDQYNFQNIEVAIADGVPSGITQSDNFLYVGDTNTIEQTRVINERLRGPDIGGSTENPYYYHSKVYRFLNKEVDKIRIGIKIASLSYTKQGDKFDISEWGDVVGTSVSFDIRYRPIYIDPNGFANLADSRGWYPTAGPLGSTVKGLSKSPYIHPIVIDLDDELMSSSLAGWEIEIVRTTVDSIESNISNQTFVDTVTTVSNNVLSYPNSALVSMNFNAEYFSQIPTRSFDMRLLKVKVPSNYDPITRQYGDVTNPWDGTFKEEKQWTDNPAWIFYDLLTNQRYGVGKFLKKVDIDKWTLYEISKFCDTLVPDGEEGKEPRFTCNTLINTREDAFKVLKDFASCFRSIIYYGFGNIHTVIDKPRDVVTQFTNANVEEGNFAYTSASENATPTVCLVRYNDKTNFYKPAIEYIENTEGIRKRGVIEKEITAFACTSRSQAIRLGRWILATDEAQNEIAQFTTGPEGMLLRPGDVIKIVDGNRSLINYGGRVVDVNETGIVLDEDLNNVLLSDEGKTANYQLTLTTPNYFYDASLVELENQGSFPAIRNTHIQTFDFSPDNDLVTVDAIEIGHSEGIGGPTSGTTITYGDANYMFSVKSGELMKESTWSVVDINTTNLYSVTSTSEKEGFKYGVEALVHSETKYDYIESGIIYSFVPSPQTATEAPPRPTSVELYVRNYPGSTNTKRLGIKVSPPSNVGNTIGYKLYIKSGNDTNDNFSSADCRPGTSIPKNSFFEQTIYLDDLTDNGKPYTFYLPHENNKRYFVRVFAINAANIMSSNFKDGQDSNGYAGYKITDHYPTRDIKIHSLRLYSEFHPTAGNTDNSATKTFYTEIQDTDFAVVWGATFFGQTVGGKAGDAKVAVSFPIEYKIRIHYPNTGSSTPLEVIDTYTTQDNYFNFNFALNRATAGGPRRHVDITVEAISLIDGDTSSQNFSNSNGWDIIEVLNPKPKGFCLTPRVQGGSRPGKDLSCSNIHSTQWVDKDGLVHLELLRNQFTDLAGGYIYVSKHPFSGADFHSNGTPKLPNERGVFGHNGSWFTAAEKFKTGEYQIVECPFEAPAGTTLDSEIIVSPPVAEGSTDPFLFSETYYMGVKFYDSFDREIKNQNINDTWSDDLWLGLARNNVSPAGSTTVLSGYYQMAENIAGWFVGDHENGTPQCCSEDFEGKYAVPIVPTKFASSHQGGFRWWVRMNVNGQWEGQGISHVRALTYKDVQDQYDYKGYFEYSCMMTERYDSVYADYNPNADDSITRCRFRQGRYSTSSDWGVVEGSPDNPYLYYNAWEWENRGTAMVTGATRTPPPIGGVKFDPLPRAGIAYGGWGDTTPNYEVDRIKSYNERNQVIAGYDRPLYGFRRFRIYFDPHNLPPVSDANKLASYGVVGMNSWNAPYEAYPNSADHADSILLAKDLGWAPYGGTTILAGIFTPTVRAWMNEGDLFENIPGVWNHHPAGFGQGFGGLVKTQKFFDVHLGRMIDDTYLNEAMFGVVSANDYAILEQDALVRNADSGDDTIHENIYSDNAFVTLPITQGGDGVINY